MRRAAGFSLLEMLMASALGAALSMALIEFSALLWRGSLLLREQAYVHGRVVEAEAALRRALGEAGYGLCRDAPGRFNERLLRRGAALSSDDDGFSVARAVEPAAAVAEHDTPTRTLRLSAPLGEDFSAGALALLSESGCAAAALLKIESVDGEWLRYEDADIARRFGRGAALRLWREDNYYLRRSSQQPALFRRRSGAALGQALLAAVETLRLEYAVDGDGDGVADGYRETPRGALAARLSLGLRGRVPLSRGAESADGFLRRRVEFVVALPNGGF